jgi:NAD(P)H-dependent FMN reductase
MLPLIRPYHYKEKAMTNIAIIIGSTRPGRVGASVAEWVHRIASKRSDATFALVDIAEFELPLLDEPLPPALGMYSHQHTKDWAARIATFDGFVFVAPEYNHGISGALKNAIDYLSAEWHNKAAGFVSYGGVGGARAVEQLRLVLAELMVATVRAQVMLSLFTDFKDFREFSPDPRHEEELDQMFSQVIGWATALKPLRTGT